MRRLEWMSNMADGASAAGGPQGADGPVVIVSVDGHATPRAAELSTYMSSDVLACLGSATATVPRPNEVERQSTLDRLGIVGEVLLVEPPASVRSRIDHLPASERLWATAAVADACNRWMSDYCARLPGRRCGIARLDPFNVSTAIGATQDAASSGLGGILLPADPDGAAYLSSDLEPLWSAVEAADLTLVFHPPMTGAWGVDGVAPRLLDTAEMYWWNARTPLELLFSGVFERHPSMRLAVLESVPNWVLREPQRLDWMAATAAKGVRQGGGEVPIRRRPSEYIGQNIWMSSAPERIAPSLIDGVQSDRLIAGLCCPTLDRGVRNWQAWTGSSASLPSAAFFENAVACFPCLDPQVLLDAAADLSARSAGRTQVHGSRPGEHLEI